MSLESKYGVFIVDEESNAELTERFPLWRKILIDETAIPGKGRVAFWDNDSGHDLDAVVAWVRANDVGVIYGTWPWDEFVLDDLIRHGDFFAKLKWIPSGGMDVGSSDGGIGADAGTALLVVYDSTELLEDNNLGDLIKRTLSIDECAGMSMRAIDLATGYPTLLLGQVCLCLLKNPYTEGLFRRHLGKDNLGRVYSFYYKEGGIRHLDKNGSISLGEMESLFSVNKLSNFKNISQFYSLLMNWKPRHFQCDSAARESVNIIDWSGGLDVLLRAFIDGENDPNIKYINKIVTSLEASNRYVERFAVLAFISVLVSEEELWGSREQVRRGLFPLLEESLVSILLEYYYSHGWSFLFLKMNSAFPDFYDYYEVEVVRLYSKRSNAKGYFSRAASALLDLYRCGFPNESEALLDKAAGFFEKDFELGRIDWFLYSKAAVAYYFKGRTDSLLALTNSFIGESRLVEESNYQLAWCCLEFGRFGEAVAVLEPGWDKTGFSRRSGRAFLEALINVGRIEEAKRVFNCLEDKRVLQAADVLLFGVTLLDRNPCGTLHSVLSQDGMIEIIRMLERVERQFPMASRLKVVYLLVLGREKEALDVFSKWSVPPNITLLDRHGLAVHCFRAGVSELIADWSFGKEKRDYDCIETVLRSFLSCAVRNDSGGLELLCDWVESEQGFLDLGKSHSIGNPSVCRYLMGELVERFQFEDRKIGVELKALSILRWEARWLLLDSNYDLQWDCLANERCSKAIATMGRGVLKLLKVKDVCSF